MQADAPKGAAAPPIDHPLFSKFFNWMASSAATRREWEPLRQEVVGQARGVVLELGAGSGLNFHLYMPEQVQRVEAIEPDATMLTLARERLAGASVPITLTQASAEALPFGDAMFDSVVGTLVFCSIGDPARALAEIWRALKPGGLLLLFEHVRSENKVAASVQTLLVPFTTRLAGNCHWNRDTAQAVAQAGFAIISQRQVADGLHPQVLLHALRPE
jgi:ubiquinone/menaquinone biosynthesis C-methylase UbiE